MQKWGNILIVQTYKTLTSHKRLTTWMPFARMSMKNIPIHRRILVNTRTQKYHADLKENTRTLKENLNSNNLLKK